MRVMLLKCCSNGATSSRFVDVRRQTRVRVTNSEASKQIGEMKTDQEDQTMQRVINIVQEDTHTHNYNTNNTNNMTKPDAALSAVHEVVGCCWRRCNKNRI